MSHIHIYRRIPPTEAVHGHCCQCEAAPVMCDVDTFDVNGTRGVAFYYKCS